MYYIVYKFCIKCHNLPHIFQILLLINANLLRWFFLNLFITTSALKFRFYYIKILEFPRNTIDGNTNREDPEPISNRKLRQRLRVQKHKQRLAQRVDLLRQQQLEQQFAQPHQIPIYPTLIVHKILERDIPLGFVIYIYF